MESKIGRLVRSTSKKCPECSTSLQVRVRNEHIMIKGESLLSPDEYEYCHKCGYENDIESKIKRSKKYSKIELVEKEEPKKVWKPKKPNIYKK